MRELNAYDLNDLMDLVRSEPVTGEALVPIADPAVSYDDFLELLPAELRGSMECRACRLWWNTYANAVHIGVNGEVGTVFWPKHFLHTKSKLKELCGAIDSKVITAFLRNPLGYRVVKMDSKIKGIRRHPAVWVVGAVGNHFGHRVIPNYTTDISVGQEVRYEQYLEDELVHLVSEPGVVESLLDSIPLRMHTHEETRKALLDLSKKFSIDGKVELLRALSNLPTGAAHVFTRLGQQYPEWLGERALAEGPVSIDGEWTNPRVGDISGVVDLLDRLQLNIYAGAPRIQSQWNMKRIAELKDLPGYVSAVQSTAPALTDGPIVNYQFTADQIVELSSKGRLVQIRPIVQIADIRLQVPARTANGESLDFVLPNGITKNTWVLLNTAVLLNEPAAIIGWVMNPVDGGQALLAAVIHSPVSGVAPLPNCRLQMDELTQVLPDDRHRILFADAERISQPKLPFAPGDLVAYDLRNMPMDAVLDGMPIRFVQVRPAEI